MTMLDATGIGPVARANWTVEKPRSQPTTRTALERLAMRTSITRCVVGDQAEVQKMNDESPRFAEGQTGAASLSSSEEGTPHFAELARHAVHERNAWVTEEGLRGATAGELFDGYCQRLSAMDVVIMRACVSTQTLHPQWIGYGYTWRRELRSVREQQFARGPVSQEWLSSPFNALIQRSLAGEENPWLRRRLVLGPEQRDFPALADFYAAGATDYVCLAFRFGKAGDRSHWTGVLYSFTTDRTGGFRASEIDLLRSTLPGLSGRFGVWGRTAALDVSRAHIGLSANS